VPGSAASALEKRESVIGGDDRSGRYPGGNGWESIGRRRARLESPVGRCPTKDLVNRCPVPGSGGHSKSRRSSSKHSLENPRPSQLVELLEMEGS